MFARSRREHRQRTLAILILSCTIISVTFSGAFPSLKSASHGATTESSRAGDAGDDNPATFTFSEDSRDLQLSTKDETPIAYDDVKTLYGRSEGMRIFVGGIDVADQAYRGPGGPKEPVGMDLSGGAGWPHVNVPSGSVAIDPVLGRFKFYERLSLGNYGTGVALDVVVRGKYAYVADGGDRGFQIVDISNAEAPTLAGHYTTKTALGIVVSRNYAYMATAVGLQILDVSNPKQPKLAGKLAGGNSYAVSVSGRYAYLATVAGLQVIDVFDPGAPSLAGSLTLDSTPFDIFVQGNLAFVAAGGDGLYVLNISNPAAPRIVAQLPSESATGIHASGNYVYLAGQAGLSIINVANPSAPTLTASLDTPGSANGVFATGTLVYVADGDAGVHAVDVTNPARPRVVQTFDTNGAAMAVFVTGNKGYVADHAGGMQVIGLTAAPSEIPDGEVTASFHYVDAPTGPKREAVTPVERGRISRFTAPRLLDRGPAMFSVWFANTGTVPLNTRGSVRLTGSFGSKTVLDVKKTKVLAGKTTKLEVRWKDPPLVGIFSARATIQFGAEKQTVTAKRSFVVFPWKIPLGIATILALTFVLERRYRKRKNAATP